MQALCSLEELCITKVPLTQHMEDDKVRRQACISRLPRVRKLNKTTVTEGEREAAERWLLRDMADHPNPPAYYQALVEKHGHLNPLAEVNLGPPRTVTMHFHYAAGERIVMEERTVSLEQTVWDFKTWIAEELLTVPVNSFELSYDNGLMANKWLPRSLKPLGIKDFGRYMYQYKDLKYRFCDGCEIHITMK